MSFGETVLLGAIAGLTIYLGLPLGRIHRIDERLRVALAMFSVGILVFIFMDVSAHGESILSGAVDRFKHHTGSLGHVVALFALLALTFTVGTGGIASAERWLRSLVAASSRPPIAGSDATASTADAPLDVAHVRRRALQAGMTIAAAIGLHNFAEGLAIGVSARSGAIGLATVLVVGFALHNATEGFGIVGPLAGVRPSWRWLALAGLVAGGPTFLGSLVGYQVNSDLLELGFYGLAGGAILYVVGEIWGSMRRHGHRTLGLYVMALGFLVGVGTDLIVSYGGG
jgi:ZIP family zinc transporter